jgi:hypothetical protein
VSPPDLGDSGFHQLVADLFNSQFEMTSQAERTRSGVIVMGIGMHLFITVFPVTDGFPGSK